MTQQIQKINETKMYRKLWPITDEVRDGAIWKKLKFIRGNLTRAAGRDRPQNITVTLDYVYEVGESQNWLDPFTKEHLEFDRGGDWGMKNAFSTRASNPLSCSIDRIDSSKGYVKGNIQLVTAKTNVAKGNMSNDEFTNYCKKVAKNCR